MTPFRTSLSADTMNMLVTSRLNLSRVKVHSFDYREPGAKGRLGSDPPEDPLPGPSRHSTSATSATTVPITRSTTAGTDDMTYVHTDDDDEDDDLPDADFEPIVVDPTVFADE